MEPIFSGGHFYIEEIRCPCCGRVWPGLRTEPIFRAFFDRMEDVRTCAGTPLVVIPGGGCRCLAYERKYHPEVILSAHSFVALDVNFVTREQLLRCVHYAGTKYPDLRIGYIQYVETKQNFTHFDMAHLVSPRPLGVENDWQPGAKW